MLFDFRFVPVGQERPESFGVGKDTTARAALGW
jgi:hypothetical protein